MIGNLDGMKSIAHPQYQAQFKHLFEIYNKAIHDEKIVLHGRVFYNRAQGVYLSWDFENYQPIQLESLDFDLRKFVGKEVKIWGTKKFIFDFKKMIRAKDYLQVNEIQEESFPWSQELQGREPIIRNLEDYTAYLPFSEKGSEWATKSFILSLIGLKKEQGTAGIGLTTTIPENYHQKAFDPFKKAYTKLDPFSNREGRLAERYSLADYVTPNSYKIITRQMDFKEIDYVLATKPSSTNSIIANSIWKHSELFAPLGPEGLDSAKYNKAETNNIQYAIFYANKAINPIIDKETYDELEKLQIRIERRLINENPSLETYTTERIARGKQFEDTLITLAKANNQTKITSPLVKKLEELVTPGLTNAILNEFTQEIIMKKTEEYLNDLKLDRESSYKKIEDLHSRIMAEISIKPQSKEELWERLKNDFEKKKFDNTLEELINWGRIYEKEAKLNKA